MTLTRNDVIDVLTACSSVDLRKVGDTDVDGWTATLRSDLDRNLALEAVRIHYVTSTERIMPGHVNKLALQLRRDRAEREPAADRELRQLQHDMKHGLASGDAQFGNLPIGSADGEPVPGAYSVNNAIEHVCPMCGADEYQACMNKVSGSARKIPCLPRLRIEAVPNPKYMKQTVSAL